MPSDTTSDAAMSASECRFLDYWKFVQDSREEWRRVVVARPDSSKIRAKGNLLLRREKHFSALTHYSKALAAAAVGGAGSKDRALALANRASVLMTLGFFKESIKDGLLALEEPECPVQTLDKVHNRLATCYKQLGRSDLAQGHLAKCCHLISQHVPAEHQEQLLARVRRDFQRGFTPKAGQVGLECCPVPGGKMGVASSLSESEDQKFGKHFRANRKIKPGEIVSVEEPVFFHLNDQDVDQGMEEAGIETNFSRCSLCLKTSFTLIPCEFCSFTLFCSQTCKETGWQRFHKSECRARRKFAQSRPPWASGAAEQLVHQAIKLVSLVGARVASRALSFPQQAPQPLKDLLALPQGHLEVAQAVVLRRVAFHVAATWDELLPRPCDGQMVEDELNYMEARFLADFIQLAFKVLKRNLSSLEQSQYHSETDTFDHHYVYGQGLFLSRARMPHSCVPNCFVVMYQGKTLAVVAARPIRSKEVVTVSINPLIVSGSVSSRRALLLPTLDAPCLCEACSKGWDYENHIKNFVRSISNLHAEVMRLILEFCLFDKGLASVCSGANLAKCLELQAELLKAGVPKTDVVYNHVDKFIRRHLQLAAQKFKLDGSGEAYLFASSRDMVKWLEEKNEARPCPSFKKLNE